MKKIIITGKFKKDAKRLRYLSKQIEKQVDLFISDTNHPSLRIDKLKPKHHE